MSTFTTFSRQVAQSPARSSAVDIGLPWLDALLQSLHAGAVAHDEATLNRYGRSSTGEDTPPCAVVYPTSTQQVQLVASVAHEHALKLYPIARGRNWGYGDACAASEQQVIVDLSEMDRILEVSEELGYAVIEPGVSQGQLASYLAEHHPSVWCDVTGAGHDASLMGNSLDRGFGHTPYGDHAKHSAGMSVVLADGTMVQTGMERFAQCRSSFVYSHGVGPQIEGLFVQSNLGIVTQMGISLMPVPEKFTAFFIQPKKNTSLETLVDSIAPLRRQGLLTSAIHIGNDLRVLSGRMRYPWERTGGHTPLPDSVRSELCREQGLTPWNVGGGIYGTPWSVWAAKRELTRAMGRRAKVRFIDDRRLAKAERLHRLLRFFGRGQKLAQMLTWLKPVYGLMKGQPTDEPLEGALWRVRPEFDAAEPAEPSQATAAEWDAVELQEPSHDGSHDGTPGREATSQSPADHQMSGEDARTRLDPLACSAGLRWVSPVLPNTGYDTGRVRNIIERVYVAHGFEPLITFTMISERAIIAVTNICFDTRSSEESERAERCYKAAQRALFEAGYVPYRTGHQGQQWLADASPTFSEVATRLKTALDPQQTIAPGRYIPERRGATDPRKPAPNEFM